MATTEAGNNEKEQSVEEILHETDFGQILLKYKFQIISVVMAILLIVVGGTIYLSHSKKMTNQELEAIYKYSSESLAKFKDGKLEKDELVKEIEKLHDIAGNNPAIIIVLLDSAMELKDKGFYTDAIKSIRFAKDIAGSNQYANYIISSDLAVLLEDSGDFKGAIQILEEQTKSKEKFYEAKLYLDLGRLYKLDQNIDKSRVNLKYVLDNFPNDEVAKLAKLYLDQLK